MDTNHIIQGDSRNVLADLPDDSVHAVVTDPPYGLAFMGRDWDDFEPRQYQDWCEQWARQALDVLKPGGHLLAFSGNRTHHRLFSGVEDAGFEIRDTVTWHYGSGFPKALDVSKAIDKQAGAEREKIGERPAGKGIASGQNNYGGGNSEYAKPNPITAPATDAAQRWDGFKTALKPATEYVVVARAPLSEGTVAENVQTHGTGALNIDGCRIEAAEEITTNGWGGGGMNSLAGGQLNKGEAPDNPRDGRYPSNVVFDEEAADETAERYFYTSKATRAERTLDGKIANAHPTVKPADLMEWLVRLVTAEGQVVLDPFAGTGTTCRAAKDLGREFVGIEKQRKWADVARVRCGLTPEDPAHLRPDDDAQTGLETFAADDD